MRELILAFTAAVGVAISAQAAPLVPNLASIVLGVTPSVELVRDGCGRGWHPDHWRDQSGDWH